MFILEIQGKFNTITLEIQGCFDNMSLEKKGKSGRRVRLNVKKIVFS